MRRIFVYIEYGGGMREWNATYEFVSNFERKKERKKEKSSTLTVTLDGNGNEYWIWRTRNFLPVRYLWTLTLTSRNLLLPSLAFDVTFETTLHSAALPSPNFNFFILLSWLYQYKHKHQHKHTYIYHQSTIQSQCNHNAINTHISLLLSSLLLFLLTGKIGRQFIWRNTSFRLSFNWWNKVG